MRLNCPAWLPPEETCFSGVAGYAFQGKDSAWPNWCPCSVLLPQAAEEFLCAVNSRQELLGSSSKVVGCRDTWKQSASGSPHCAAYNRCLIKAYVLPMLPAVSVCVLLNSSQMVCNILNLVIKHVEQGNVMLLGPALLLFRSVSKSPMAWQSA